MDEEGGGEFDVGWDVLEPLGRLEFGLEVVDQREVLLDVGREDVGDELLPNLSELLLLENREEVVLGFQQYLVGGRGVIVFKRLI